MSHVVLKTVQSFLIKQISPQHPNLVLAFSGGVDSSALLFALLHLREKLQFTLSLAHVDHAWRKESSAEADKIQRWATLYSLPCFITQLGNLQGNKEEASRRARLQFFCALHSQHPFDSLLQAHQQDDQIETIMKQLFEGKEWMYAKGMQSKIALSDQSGTPLSTILRPLLSLKRSLVEEWVKREKEQWNWEPFQDPSNEDNQFLRVRMRRQLLPFLERTMGKNVGDHVFRLGKVSEEMEKYFDQQIYQYLETKISGPFGFYYLLPHTSLPLFLYRHLIRKITDLSNAKTLSRSQIDALALSLLQKKCGRRFFFSSSFDSFQSYFTVDRGRLFLVQQQSCSSNLTLTIAKEGQYRYSQWYFDIRLACEEESERNCSWLDIWKGKGMCYLHLSFPFCFIPFNKSAKYGKTKLDSWCTAYRIPAFLRSCFPVIRKNEEVMHEFLTGRKKKQNKEGQGILFQFFIAR